MASCAICAKRPPKRFCPAKGEKICAVCCGREREVTIDCLPDCPHLVAAHRWEAQHRKPMSPDEIPYRDVSVSPDFVYERWNFVSAFSSMILAVQIEQKDLTDDAAIAAMEALTETYRTLGTGIYYERPPIGPIARALYGQLAKFVQEFRAETAHTGVASLKESDIFPLLVFLLRIAKQETNGRLRSRAFLGFLRARFPFPAHAAQDAPRIIIP